MFQEHKINFDLDECDKILKVLGKNNSTASISAIIKAQYRINKYKSATQQKLNS